MKTIENFTAEELIEYFYKSNHTTEEIKQICKEWLVKHVMDDWMCE